MYEIDKFSNQSSSSIATSSRVMKIEDSRNEIERKLKKNRKNNIKFKFMRRFPKIGVPTLTEKVYGNGKKANKSENNQNRFKLEKNVTMDTLFKGSTMDSIKTFDMNSIENNKISKNDDHYVTVKEPFLNEKRTRILWIVCIAFFILSILFLVSALITLLNIRKFFFGKGLIIGILYYSLFFYLAHSSLNCSAKNGDQELEQLFSSTKPNV